MTQDIAQLAGIVGQDLSVSDTFMAMDTCGQGSVLPGLPNAGTVTTVSTSGTVTTTTTI